MAATTNRSMERCGEEEVVVVIVPCPIHSHLQSLLQLSRRILCASSYAIPVHYVSSSTHIRQAQRRASGWNPLAVPNLHFCAFETPTFQNNAPDPNDNFPTHTLASYEAALELRQPVAELIKNLSSKARRVVVVYDVFMASVVQDAISVPNAECYSYHSVSAFHVCASILQANLYTDEVTDVPPDVQALLDELPAMELGGGDEPPILGKYIEKQMSCGVGGCRHIFSTCRSIDGVYIDMIQKAYKSLVDYKSWGLGLFINPLEMETLMYHKDDSTTTSTNRHHILQWLDNQEPNSVILVSFGSTVSFTDEQIKELAIGLEQSQQKFIWVLKDADRADIFASDDDEKGNNNSSSNVRPRFGLPEEYEERVEGRGVIEWAWVPQLEILSHPSIGGFLSHCGWNSCLESISTGVPIAAWPMHSEQPKNALFLTKGLKISIFVRDWARRKELVRAETIKTAVETLMASPEGEKMRQKAAELRNVVKASFMDGGSTQNDILSFISYITR